MAQERRLCSKRKFQAGCPCRYLWRRSTAKSFGQALTPWRKNKHFDAGIHKLKVRTCMTQEGSRAPQSLSVLKRCVSKTLAFAFGLRLRSKIRRSKTRVLGRRSPNGKPQERLRFRALRGKTLAFKKTHCDFFLRLKDFPRCQGLRSGRAMRSKNAAFCICISKPAKLSHNNFVLLFRCLLTVK